MSTIKAPLKCFEAICTLLNLGQPLSHPTRVYGGLLHRMWHLQTANGLYAIKQLSKDVQLTPETRNNYELSEQTAGLFKALGIPAIHALIHNGKHLINCDNSTFLVYPWSNATILTHNKIQTSHAIKIARIVAQMHTADLQITELSGPHFPLHTNKEISHLITQSEKLDLSFAQQLKRYKKNLLSINDTYKECIPMLQKTTRISHGDLDQKNVLWDEDENPILIDWESTRKVNPTYEIIDIALNWSGITTDTFNEKIFISIIAEYKKAGSTIEKETVQATFFGILGNWTDWMLFNIQRSITATSANPEDITSSDNQVVQTMQTMQHIERHMTIFRRIL